MGKDKGISSLMAEEATVHLARAIAEEWLRDMEARGPVYPDTAAIHRYRVTQFLLGKIREWDQVRADLIEKLQQQLTETLVTQRTVIVRREERG